MPPRASPPAYPPKARPPSRARPAGARAAGAASRAGAALMASGAAWLMAVLENEKELELTPLANEKLDCLFYQVDQVQICLLPVR